VKKLFIVALSLAFVFAWGMAAHAGIRNTIHDFQSKGAMATGPPGSTETSARGMCSYCHIPHSAKGERLWPTPGSNTMARAGLVGNLCGTCHFTAANNDNSPATGTDDQKVLRSTDVYNTGRINHVLIDDSVYGNNTNQDLIGGSTQFNQQNIWPYCGTQGTTIATVRIECSSCHNPHNESIPGGQSLITGETNATLGYGNDYLRSAMYNRTSGVAFCEYCHEEKTRAKAAGPQNSIGTGTHPVGTTASANNPAQADIHIESDERAFLRANAPAASPIVSSVMYDVGIGQYIASATACDTGVYCHLTGYNTGGVTCQSCHLVHGAPVGGQAVQGANGSTLTAGGTGTTWDQGSSTGSYLGTASKVYLAASDDGYASILAIDNDANGGGAGYVYQTEGRSTGDYNDLCVDCHETTPSVGTNWLTLDNNARRTGGDIGTDAHPVNIAPDGRSEVGFDLTVKDPEWRNTVIHGSVAGNWTNARWAGATDTKRDNSFAAAGRWDGDSAPAGARNEVVCLTCHAIHDGEAGTPILRAASATYCQDCHAASLGAVSHPVGTGSAMRDNPDGATWPNADILPLANYYQGDPASGTAAFGGRYASGTPGAITTNMECHTCHAAHDGVDEFMLRVTDDNSRICTGCHTDIVAGGGENPSNYIAEYQEGATARMGSHYTGTVTNTNQVSGETRWAYTGSWTDTTSTPRQTAHWGTGGAALPRMQCQSCHTPHDAASGLVEDNSYDGNAIGLGSVDFVHPLDDLGTNVNYDGTTGTRMSATPYSALLLGNNRKSKMCATCHWPRGTHVTTIYSVSGKVDPNRATGGSGDRTKYRDWCTRTNNWIIKILNGGQETRYFVYDLIANDSTADTVETPESPTNFPPYFPGIVPTDTQGEMLCDSCHAPHGAATGSGAFILEAGSGYASTLALANQRVFQRNYQDLCWKCHDK